MHSKRVAKCIQKRIAHCNFSTVKTGAMMMDSADTLGEAGLIVKRDDEF